MYNLWGYLKKKKSLISQVDGRVDFLTFASAERKQEMTKFNLSWTVWCDNKKDFFKVCQQQKEV